MSKIICDVCGTSYPETATQCPICGYVNPNNAQTASTGSAEGESTGTYQYVKGGRFSKSNVKKRNQGKPPVIRNTTTAKVSTKRSHSSGSGNGGSNDNGDKKKSTGLIVAVVLILLAIIAVVIYISLELLGPDAKLPMETDAPAVTTEETTISSAPQEVLCENITINVSQIAFEKAGASRMLYVKLSPEDTSEKIMFASSDETVATVNQAGMITAVGHGEAIITVSCGEVSVQCVVTCDIPEETTEETTSPTETTTTELEEFKLNRKDITFSKKGDVWVLYDGNIGKTKITFSTDNDKVAVFEGGTVKAVGSGKTTVHAEYMGKKVSCIIRCNFASDTSNPGVEGNGGGVSEEGSGTSGNNFKIYTQYGSTISDATIKVGESLQLSLRDSDGNAVNTKWRVSGSGVSLSGGSVSGVDSGSACTVSTTYNGQTYSCTIRVK